MSEKPKLKYTKKSTQKKALESKKSTTTRNITLKPTKVKKKLTKIKKITGQRLTKAWQSIPHVTQFIESDATNLEALRQKAKTIKKVKDGGIINKILLDKSKIDFKSFVS